MIKRPVNKQFTSKVLQGIKCTTIRDNPWPKWKPIMLYNWSGAAYRSKQIDVSAILVMSTHKIEITRADDCVKFSIEQIDGRELWETEGFESKKALHDWFRPLVKNGQTITKSLMCFRLMSEEEKDV